MPHDKHLPAFEASPVCSLKYRNGSYERRETKEDEKGLTRQLNGRTEMKAVTEKLFNEVRDPAGILPCNQGRASLSAHYDSLDGKHARCPPPTLKVPGGHVHSYMRRNGQRMLARKSSTKRSLPYRTANVNLTHLMCPMTEFRKRPL